MNLEEWKHMGCRSPVGDGCDRTHPRAKLEASASMVKGRSGLKCRKMGAEVKACCRAQKTAFAATGQVNLTDLRVREVRGDARED